MAGSRRNYAKPGACGCSVGPGRRLYGQRQFSESLRRDTLPPLLSLCATPHTYSAPPYVVFGSRVRRDDEARIHPCEGFLFRGPHTGFREGVPGNSVAHRAKGALRSVPLSFSLGWSKTLLLLIKNTDDKELLLQCKLLRELYPKQVPKEV